LEARAEVASAILKGEEGIGNNKEVEMIGRQRENERRKGREKKLN